MNLSSGLKSSLKNDRTTIHVNVRTVDNWELCESCSPLIFVDCLVKQMVIYAENGNLNETLSHTPHAIQLALDERVAKEDKDQLCPMITQF